MGQQESKKIKKQVQASSNQTTDDPPRGKVQSKVKRVLLLYKADVNNKQQLDIIDAFRDELVNAGLPLIKIKEKVNLSTVNASSMSQDLEWLNEINNIILIRLSSDAIEDVEKIMRAKNFVNGGSLLHNKILTVSFGKTTPPGWPPSGIKRSEGGDQKDFCFKFEDECTVTADDFESTGAKKTLNSIVKALAACS